MLAAALQAAALPQDSSAVELFGKACEQGELRLAADRAKLVQRSDVGSRYLEAFGWERPSAETTYVEIMQPSNTYLFIENPTEEESRTFSVVCRMATRSMSSADGDRAFIGDLMDPNISFAWGDQFYQRFTIDRPEQGFRKRLRRAGGYTYLDVAIYREPAKAN